MISLFKRGWHDGQFFVIVRCTDEDEYSLKIRAIRSLGMIYPSVRMSRNKTWAIIRELENM